MNLTSIYERHDRCHILYTLLEERDETANISHRGMPHFDDHCDFVNSRPYEAWYFINEFGDGVVGAVYLSKQNEIGIQIFKMHQGKGYGPKAVQLMMHEHGERRYLANVNPKNARSQGLFASLGFELIQHTYAAIPSR